VSDRDEWTIRTVESIGEVEADAWDACAVPPGRPRNPFLTHAFLHALEASGSAVPDRGWQPFHLLLEDPEGRLAGAVPLYVKGHSRGEYIFDYAWADAFHRAGGRYYPKLLSAVPFTPVTGPRLLVADHAEPREAIEARLVEGALEVARRTRVSSLHLNFLPADQWERLGGAGLLQRTDQQFHWTNAGYGSFDDFLASLSSKKRKNLKRERKQALEDDVTVEWVTGDALTEAHWDAFYRFYLDTSSRKWGDPYLTREFFSRIGETLADEVLLILARRGGRWIAGALNLIGSDALYGRNWGCIEEHRFLHFEVCYYQAIDFAITRGLDRVEAGAQGTHKVARGYLPVRTHSAHWIAHPGLREAVADYLDQERGWVAEDMAAIGAHSPFRVVADPEAVREED
jgi:predicted N-acyltransferase